MKIIGLTGPTGGGKSTVSTVAEQLGYSVIDCDKVAREVSNETEIINKLADAFGKNIIEKNDAVVKGEGSKNRIRRNVGKRIASRKKM